MKTTIAKILSWVVSNRKMLFKAICGLSVGILMLVCINTCRQNKKLSESLEIAQNNIEAYQGELCSSQQAFNVLKLDMETLQYQNDSVIQKLDEIRKKNKIKSSNISTAATQTQSLLVSKSKGVGGDVLLKDTIYNDSIKYNDLTTVYYSISKDTIDIMLDINNSQYLYIYYTKEYKNKKSFLKRLFTFDFKKVTKYKYDLINTNDLINTSDIRIIESINK